MAVNRMNPVLLVGALLAGGCDYSGDFLFAEVQDVPSVIHLDGPMEGGHFEAKAFESAADIQANTIYAEVGAPSSASPGGVTFTFQGTGRDVCVWVDPEVVFWNQKVGGGAQNAGYAYPDNVFDDGDLDLYVGLSVYYTGSPGEAMGDFVVIHEDSLGNEVPIELVSCSNTSGIASDVVDSHSGRAMAEYCTIRATDPGISYTAALRTFSAPLDDDRLGFGFVVYDGSCASLKVLGGASATMAGDECVIKGEAIVPQGPDYGPWTGFSEERTWAGSMSLEDAFCAQEPATYCKEEADAVLAEGMSCSWEDAGIDGGARCFCGNPLNNPEIGEG